MKNNIEFINLVESFKLFPGIGEKSAERMAYKIIEMSNENINSFIDSINNVKNKIHKCPNCGALIMNDECNYCIKKDYKKCIVLSKVKDIELFEEIADVFTTFHVLDGEISPIKGITVKDINIEKLEKRIKDENINELIIATSPTLEGETTALYIAKYLEDLVVTSRLGYGVPINSNFEYIDKATLTRAIENRKEIK